MPRDLRSRRAAEPPSRRAAEPITEPASYPTKSIPSSTRRTNAATNRGVRAGASSVTIAFGNRVARCTTATCSAGEREINDGSQFVLARSGSGAIADAYGYYPGGDQPMSLKLPSGRTGVFITDPQLRGTVRAIVDGNGQATNAEFKTYAISPWGEVAADTGSITRLRMAGQQYDQGSRLYYMRARYYDPQLGRFLSEDPIGISGGLNLYAYAGNDPVNMWDPSGTSASSGDHCLTSDNMMGAYDANGVCQPVTITLPDMDGGPGLGNFPITFVPGVQGPVTADQGPPGMQGFEDLFSDAGHGNGPLVFGGVQATGVMGMGGSVSIGVYKTGREWGIYVQAAILAGVDVGLTAQVGGTSDASQFGGAGMTTSGNLPPFPGYVVGGGSKGVATIGSTWGARAGTSGGFSFTGLVSFAAYGQYMAKANEACPGCLLAP